MDAQLPPDENRDIQLEAIWWSEISVATCLIFLRLWARTYKRSLGLDDALMIGAWLGADPLRRIWCSVELTYLLHSYAT